MTQNQRIALIVMLSGMAFVLHALFFEWATAWDPPGASYIFSSLTCDGIESGCLRIWYDSATFQNSLLSVLLGIVLPLAMLCGAGYMWLGTDPSDPKKSACAQLANEGDDKSAQ